MSDTLEFAALRARFEADEQASRGGETNAVVDRLTNALDAMGWRSAGGASSDEIASFASHILDACVTGHRDLGLAARDLADLMRTGVDLDGSLPPVSAFLPAAEDLLRRYAAR
jgi:hypothetical protein